MKQAVKATLITVLFIVAFSTVTFFHFSHDRSFTRLKREGNIRIGYAISPPYAFVTPDGRVTGESPEVARRIVARLGIPHIQWRQVPADALISGLESGRFDVVASGMIITPEREKHVCFSEPTFHASEGLLVRKGNPLNLHSYLQPLTLIHIRFAVVTGSLEETVLKLMGLPKNQVVFVPDILSGRAAVESGIADGLAVSSPTIRWMVLNNELGETEIAKPFTQPVLAKKENLGYGAFAFRNGARQLQSAWDNAMGTFIGSREHLKLISQFGFTRGDLPETIITAEMFPWP